MLHLRPEYERGYRLMLIAGEKDAAAWNRFRRAVEIFRGRAEAKAKPGKVCYPLRADGTIQQPRLADLDGEGYGRALSPLIKAGIDDLEQLAAMDDGQLLALKGVGGKTVETVRVMLADHGLHLRRRGPSGREGGVTWLYWISSAAASRSAAIRIGQQVKAANGKMRPARLTPSGSPPPSERTAARHRRPVRRGGARHGRASSRSSPTRSEIGVTVPPRDAGRSRSGTRCGTRADASGAATPSMSRSATARACARTPKNPGDADEVARMALERAELAEAEPAAGLQAGHPDQRHDPRPARPRRVPPRHRLLLCGRGDRRHRPS